MTPPTPLVSICIPTYQGARWIRETIASALAQDYPFIEVVVSDDASADGTADIAASLRQVFAALQEIQQAETGGIDLPLTAEVAEEAPSEKTALTPTNSIQNDKVICLECRAEMKQLTQKHLSAHGMTPKEYKKKHGFTLQTSLAAKSLTKARSKAAKKRGLPENLLKAIEAKRQAKAKAAKASMKAPAEAVTATKPKQTRIRKKKATV